MRSGSGCCASFPSCHFAAASVGVCACHRSPCARAPLPWLDICQAVSSRTRMWWPQVSPVAHMMSVTLACSFAFMLPISTPPNAIAFSTKAVTSRSFSPDCSAAQALIDCRVFAQTAPIRTADIPVEFFPLSYTSAPFSLSSPPPAHANLAACIRDMLSTGVWLNLAAS